MTCASSPINPKINFEIKFTIMAKSQAPKGGSKVPNKILYSRMSYLYQAATYLALHGNDTQKEQTKGTDSDTSMEDIDQCQSKVEANVTGSCQSLSRRLISEFRLVSQKGMMRISPEMKHSMCKNCQTLLMEGTTCTAHVENRSKGGKKPWADVLVRKCNTCGLEKRFPLAAERQPRRPRRSTKEDPASKSQFPSHKASNLMVIQS